MKKKSLLLILLMALITPWAVNAQTQDATLYDGTDSNGNVPMYTSYCDNGFTSEFIIPASAFEDYNIYPGSLLHSITLYQKQTNPWVAVDLTINLTNTETESYSSAGLLGSSGTTVYTNASYSANSAESHTFEFSSSFEYTGGSLIVQISAASGGTWKSSTWYGTKTTTNQGYYIYGSYTGSLQKFIPKTTFNYTPGTAPATPKPTNFAVSNILHNQAELSWTENGSATSWQICVNDDEANLITTTDNPHILTGLTPQTAYTVKVRSVGTPNSDWSSSKSFTTTAQATAVGDSWSDDFEGTECGWELINGTCTNAWAWGTGTNNGGTHSLYVSNNNGTSNEYTNNAAGIVYATKLLQFTENKYEFSYNWKAYGNDSGYDYLRVALVPASVTLTANASTSVPSGFSSTTLPTGWIALDGGSQLQGVTAWQSKDQAITVAAGNYYLALVWRNDGSGGSQPPAAVDNVSITRVACSYDVTGLAVSGITTSGATLIWTAGEATQWQVAYATTNNFEGATEEIVSAATYPMTSLTDGTHYYVRVRAYCGGSDYGSWSSVVEFDTKCFATTVSNEGWTENFDGYTVSASYSPAANDLPICWSYINDCTHDSYKIYPTMSAYSPSNNAHSTDNYLRLYSFYSQYTNYDPQPQYAILPEMNNLDGTRIKLWARGYNATSTFKIGRMTDPDDASTFVQIGNALGFTSENYQTYQKFIVNLTGTGDYIAIMIDAATESRTNNGVYIDDITVEPLPSCVEPSVLECTATTATTATLQWTAGGTEATWDIFVTSDLLAEPASYTIPTISKTSDNPATVPGLTANTPYHAWVRAHCSDSDQSSWVGGISFQTDCESIATFPWTEDFEELTENNSIPYCWDNEDGTATGSSIIWCFNTSTSGNGATNGTGHNDSKCVRFNSYSPGSGLYNCLKTVPLSLPASPAMQLSFWYKNPAGGDLSVYLSTDGGATYTTELATGLTGASFWTEQDPISLGAYAGQDVVIVFKATSNCGYNDAYIYLDDVTVNEAPSCSAPNALGAVPSTTSAQLSWTANSGETAWTIYYKKTSESAYTDKAATTNPYTLSPLEANTNYDYYVVANCSSTETSDPSAVYYFTTECEPFTITATNKYTQGFESPVVTSTYNSTTGLIVPNCWDNYTDNTSTAYAIPHIIKSDAGTSGYNYSNPASQVLYLYGAGNGYAALPEFTNALNELQISFKYATEGSTQGTLTLGYITAEDNGKYNTFTAIAGASYTPNTNCYQKMYEVGPIDLSSLPATATRLVFRWYYSSWYGCNVDDVKVELIPTCKVPTDLTCTGYTATTATFDWTSNGDNQTAWQLYISETNVAPANDIAASEVINVTTKPYTVPGLTAEKTYYAWVRGNCTASSEGYSEWVGGVEFMPSAYKDFTYQDGATSNTGNVPFYGGYNNNATNKGQILIPASAFPAEMVDATVRRLTFYTTSSYANVTWGDAEFDVLVTEVDATSFETAAFFDWTGMTTVYSGKLSVSGNQMVVDLDTPFSYTGGNLVIGFDLTKSGTSAYAYWVANFESNCNLGAYQYGTSSVSRVNYKPKTTFNYMPNPTPRPINPHATEELSTEATMAWTAPNSTEVTGYQYQYKVATATEWPTALTDGSGLTANITGLTPETTYDFRVRAVYPGPAYSQYAETQFTTTASCAIPDGLAAANLTQNTADLTWNASTEVLAYTVEYRTATTDAALFKEDFEDGIANWTFISMNTVNGIGGTGTYPAGIVSAAAHNSSNGGFRFSSYTKKESGDGVTYDQYLISHELTVTGDLKFYAWRYGTSDKLYYGTSTTTDDVDAFTWEELTFTTTSSWEEFQKEVTSGVKYIAFHYFGDYAFYAYLDDITIGEYTIPQGTWAAATTTAPNTGEYTIGGLTAGTKYDVRVYANCAIDPETDNTSTTFTTLADNNIVFPETGVWNSANFEPAVDPTVADNVIIRANVTITDGNNAYANNVTLENGAVITIENGATLTINGTVTGGGSDKIIIEDGGQLIHNNSLSATVKNNITAPAVWKGTSDADGWYLIATPVYSSTISSTFTGTIDLFKYNEPTAYWWSYNNGSHTFTSMSRGTGYLHASQTSQTVSYTGSMISTESSETISLSYAYDGSDDIKGFNLIGNPFTRNLVIGDMKIGETPVSTIYVITADDRTKLTAVTTDEYEIKPCEGFFVQATATSQSLTLNPAAKDEFEFRYIKIVAGNENGSDNAYIQLENGNTLSKMNIANKTSVSVIDNGEDFAAATIYELAGSMPVNFKAVEDGNYTITVNAKNIEPNTMILVDAFTGEEVNLLETPNYSFKATTNDEDNRFKIIFDCNTYTGIEENFTNEIFAYQYGREIMVNGEGELQVFDVMGRMVLSTRINGVERINVPANAVYIFKLNEKVQKIVVR
ncbi:MAG: fibronectin type III domain-containing protein [Bacteroidales bacterium]|nr:fibronectin type III domain-containing protein [Bacteroidales bacterium]